MGILAASGPLDHVLDTSHWHVLESLGIHFHLPVIGGLHITKYMVLQLVAAGLIMAIFIPISRRARNGEPPTGFFWNCFESVLTFIRDRVARPYIGEKDADRFVPFLWTLFLYVLFCNLLGMIPYMGSPTASITVTGVLAICAFIAIHGAAIAKMGFFPYILAHAPHAKIPFGMGYLLIPMIVAIELGGHFIKAFVLAVRLFANMLAGHTVLSVILLFIVMAKGSAFYLFWPITIGSVLGVTALSLLELFVAFLQAFIFTFLTALFMGMSLNPQH